MTPQLSARLTIQGHSINRELIEGITQVQSTEFLHEGDPVLRTTAKRKEDQWEFRLPFRPCYYVEEAIDDLRALFETKADGLRRICAENVWRVVLTCVVEIEDETAGMFLSPETIQWIASLGASLEVDTYRTVLKNDDASAGNQ